MTNTATGRRGARRSHLLAPSRVKSGALRVEPVLSDDTRQEEISANNNDEQVLFENEDAFKYEGEEEEEERHQLLVNNNQSRNMKAGMEERNLRERLGGGELGHESESSRYFGLFSNYFLPYNNSNNNSNNTASHLPYGSPAAQNIYQLPSGGGSGDHSFKNQAKLSTMRSHSRLALLIPIFLLLIMCSSLLLIKLMSLIELKKLQLNQAISTSSTFKLDVTHLDDLHQRQLELERMSRWLVSSPKCHIPKLEPWDGSIREYVHRQEPLECRSVISESLSDNGTRHLYPKGRTTQTLSFVRNQRLYFSSQALAQGALVGRCCMRQVNRSIENDDDLDLTSLCEPIRLDGLKEEEEKALEQVARVKLNEQEYYNVLMVGVDTMSSLNAQRQLKRTLALLQERLQTLHFEGYNKVGENTFPNLVPLLTGLKPEQLAEIQCWEVRNYTQGSDMGDGWLDNCKYLWNYYQQLGYVTYFSEDWPQASTFNYLKSGFKNEPTTYYGRPFTLARKELTFPQFESTGCASCQLDRPIVEIDLENLHAFISEHQTKPYFAFHWINCPQHDDINGGSQIDGILENFFQQLFNPDTITNLNRTFVMLFSDHGYRWNDFVSTRIGHYESSLPLMTIAPPKLFIDQQPELYARLKEHQGALLTPFDIFKTLIDLKNLGSSKKKQQQQQSSTKKIKRKVMGDFRIASPLEDIAISPADPMRKQIMSVQVNAASNNVDSIISEVKPLDGTTYKQIFTTLSLFDKHTPEQLDRSCIDAGIPDNYCVCHQFQPMALNKTEALGAAYYLVYIHMGTKLRNHLELCHSLDLEKIHNVEVFKFNNNNTNSLQGSRKKRQVAAPAPLPFANLPPIMPLMSPVQMVSMFDPSHIAPIFKQQQMTPLGIPQVSTSFLSNAADKLSSKKKPDQLTTSRPKVSVSSTTTTTTNLMSERSARLPDREYSLVFSTKPGSGLFQEVVRFYGSDMDKCEREILLARSIIDDLHSTYADRRASVKKMNSICEFSVHSQSMSRFNLYKEQSKCVTSDIELKKICYCNDLL